MIKPTYREYVTEYVKQDIKNKYNGNAILVFNIAKDKYLIFGFCLALLQDVEAPKPKLNKKLNRLELILIEKEIKALKTRLNKKGISVIILSPVIGKTDKYKF